jgi:hypothetical protein
MPGSVSGVECQWGRVSVGSSRFEICGRSSSALRAPRFGLLNSPSSIHDSPSPLKSHLPADDRIPKHSVPLVQHSLTISFQKKPRRFSSRFARVRADPCQVSLWIPTHPVSHIRLKVLLPGNIHTHTPVLELRRGHLVAVHRHSRDDHIRDGETVLEREFGGGDDVVSVELAQRGGTGTRTGGGGGLSGAGGAGGAVGRTF